MGSPDPFELPLEGGLQQGGSPDPLELLFADDPVSFRTDIQVMEEDVGFTLGPPLGEPQAAPFDPLEGLEGMEDIMVMGGAVTETPKVPSPRFTYVEELFDPVYVDIPIAVATTPAQAKLIAVDKLGLQKDLFPRDGIVWGQYRRFYSLRMSEIAKGAMDYEISQFTGDVQEEPKPGINAMGLRFLEHVPRDVFDELEVPNELRPYFLRDYDRFQEFAVAHSDDENMVFLWKMMKEGLGFPGHLRAFNKLDEYIRQIVSSHIATRTYGLLEELYSRATLRRYNTVAKWLSTMAHIGYDTDQELEASMTSKFDMEINALKDDMQAYDTAAEPSSQMLELIITRIVDAVLYYRPFASALEPAHQFQLMSLTDFKQQVVPRVTDVNPPFAVGFIPQDGTKNHIQALSKQMSLQTYSLFGPKMLHDVVQGQGQLERMLYLQLFYSNEHRVAHPLWAPALDYWEAKVAYGIDQQLAQGQIQEEMKMRRFEFVFTPVRRSHPSRTTRNLPIIPRLYLENEQPAGAVSVTTGVELKRISVRGLLDDALTGTTPEVTPLKTYKFDKRLATVNVDDPDILPNAQELRAYTSILAPLWRTSLRTLDWELDTPRWKHSPSLSRSILVHYDPLGDVGGGPVTDLFLLGVDVPMWILGRRFAVIRGPENTRMSPYYGSETRALCDWATSLGLYGTTEGKREATRQLGPNSVAGEWRDYITYQRDPTTPSTVAKTIPVISGTVPSSAQYHWDALCNTALFTKYTSIARIITRQAEEQGRSETDLRKVAVDLAFRYGKDLAEAFKPGGWATQAISFLRDVFLTESTMIWMARGHASRRELQQRDDSPQHRFDKYGTVVDTLQGLMQTAEAHTLSLPPLQVPELTDVPDNKSFLDFLRRMAKNVSDIPLILEHYETPQPIAVFQIGVYIYLFRKFVFTVHPETSAGVLALLRRRIMRLNIGGITSLLGQISEQITSSPQKTSGDEMFTVSMQVLEKIMNTPPTSDPPIYTTEQVLLFRREFTELGRPSPQDPLTPFMSFEPTLNIFLPRFVPSPVQRDNWVPIMRGSEALGGQLSPNKSYLFPDYGIPVDEDFDVVQRIVNYESELFASGMVKKLGTPELRFRWHANKTRPPRLHEGEVGYVVRFYVPGSTDVVEIDWDDKSHEIVLAGPDDKGLGILLLARREVQVDPGDKPHERFRIRGMAIATESKSTSLALTDPSDDYAVVAHLILSGIKDWTHRDIEKLLVRPTAILDAYEEQNALAPAPLVAATRRMRLRRYTTAAGELPAAAFALEGERQAPADSSLVDYLLGAGAYMAGWPLEELRDQLKSIVEERPRKLSDLQRKAIGIAFSGITLVGTCNDYVNDIKKDNVDAERFQIPLSQREGEGDCEDVTKEIQLLCRAIQRMTNGHVMSLLMKEYDIIMLTAVATTPALQRYDATDRGDNPDDYICHVFAAAVPLQATDRMLGIQYDEIGDNDLQHALKEMGAIILEGTNFTTPLLRELPAYIHDTALAKQCAAAKWKELGMRADRTVLPQSIDDLGYELTAVPTLRRPRKLGQFSSFYRFVTGAWIVRDTMPSAIDFMVTQHTRGGPSNRVTDEMFFGTTMQNFVELQDVVRLHPYYMVDEQTKEDMLDLLAYQPPLMPFGPDTTSRNSALGGDSWARIQAISTKLQFHTDKPFWKPFIDIRMQHINELTAVRLWELERLVNKRGWKLDARVFQMHSDIAVYQIRLMPSDKDMKAAGRYVAKFKKLMP